MNGRCQITILSHLTVRLPSLLENFGRDKGQTLCDIHDVIVCISMTSPCSLNRSTILF